MLILAVDTAGPFCSVGLYGGGADTEIASISDDIGRGHAEYLPVITQRLLADTGFDFSQIDRLAVTIGPGSFAGIRVGIAFVRALALALGIPAIGISSLKAMATEVSLASNQNTLVIQDARRGEFYICGMDDQGDEIIPPKAVQQDNISEYLGQMKWSLCGSGLNILNAEDLDAHTIIHHRPSPNITWVARLAAKHKAPFTPPSPDYLRTADAKKNTNFALARI